MTDKFRKMHNKILSRTDLNAGAKLVYSVIADRQGDNGHCWPGIRTLAKDVGMSAGAVQRAIEVLDAAGLILVDRTELGASNHYRLPESVSKIDTLPAVATVPETETGCPRNEDTGVPKTDTEVSPKRVHNQTDSLNQTKEPEGFELFWKEWPRHPRKTGKAKCKAKWKRDKLDLKVVQIVKVVKMLKASEAWRKEGGQFIPAPLVFLNKERYDCELVDLMTHQQRMAEERKTAPDNPIKPKVLTEPEKDYQWASEHKKADTLAEKLEMVRWAQSKTGRSNMSVHQAYIIKAKHLREQ